jgi:hypothetical protein
MATSNTAVDIQAVYKSKDGKIFPTAAEAQRRNRLLDAEIALKFAVTEFSRALGSNALTADGQPFEILSRDYWRIARVHGGDLPRLVRVSIWPYWSSIEVDRERIVVREFDSGERAYRTYAIDELYADERAAKIAHLEACEKAASEMQLELARLKDGYRRK